MSNESKFQELNNANKIWAIGSIHSSLESFQSIKKYILSNFDFGDKLVFLGNIIGFGSKSKEIISEVLDLRFHLMAKFYLTNEDTQCCVRFHSDHQSGLRRILNYLIHPLYYKSNFVVSNI